jgi:hypothetical protein
MNNSLLKVFIFSDYLILLNRRIEILNSQDFRLQFNHNFLESFPFLLLQFKCLQKTIEFISQMIKQVLRWSRIMLRI